MAAIASLPEFLVDIDGEIHIVGHRICLQHIVRAYDEGMSAEEVAYNFPTLDLAMIYKVIGFYLENRPAVEQYMRDHDAAMDELKAWADKNRKGPSIEELRRRLETRRRLNAG